MKIVTGKELVVGDIDFTDIRVTDDFAFVLPIQSGERDGTSVVLSLREAMQLAVLLPQRFQQEMDGLTRKAP